MTPQLKLFTGDYEVAPPPCNAPPPRPKSHLRKSAQSAVSLLTEAQRKAIFAIIHQRGLSIDDVRALCPHHSISKLTIAAAATLLEQLNTGTKYSRLQPYVGVRRARSGARTPDSRRRSPGTIALLEDRQVKLIARYRVALGWTPDMLTSHLQARKYPNQNVRTMDQITTQFDAQAVIEHLKLVLHRTLHYHGKKLGRDVPELDDPRTDAVKWMMADLPPHDRLSDLYTDRIKRLTRRLGESQRITESRLANQKRGDGRCMSAIASCADMAEAVLYLEQELARTPIPQDSPQRSAPHAIHA